MSSASESFVPSHFVLSHQRTKPNQILFLKLALIQRVRWFNNQNPNTNEKVIIRTNKTNWHSSGLALKTWCLCFTIIILTLWMLEIFRVHYLCGVTIVWYFNGNSNGSMKPSFSTFISIHIWPNKQNEIVISRFHIQSLLFTLQVL